MEATSVTVAPGASAAPVPRRAADQRGARERRRREDHDPGAAHGVERIDRPRRRSPRRPAPRAAPRRTASRRRAPPRRRPAPARRARATDPPISPSPRNAMRIGRLSRTEADGRDAVDSPRVLPVPRVPRGQPTGERHLVSPTDSPADPAPSVVAPADRSPRRPAHPRPARRRPPAGPRSRSPACSGQEPDMRDRRDGGDRRRGARGRQGARRRRAHGLPPARRHRRGGHPRDQGALAGLPGRHAHRHRRRRDDPRIHPGRRRRLPHQGPRGRRRRRRRPRRPRRRDAAAALGDRDDRPAGRRGPRPPAERRRSSRSPRASSRCCGR